MTTRTAPAGVDDPINRAILAVSEDQLQGFQRDPLSEIARRSGVDLDTVRERIVAMLEAGTIRRVRQTLLATNLARGALVAWVVPEDRLRETFDYMFREDPFSGHVVVRTTDAANPGARYRLWTTLKVPQGYSLHKHAQYLCTKTGADRFRLMPAKRLFSLGVGHLRRREIEPGDRSDGPGRVLHTEVAELDANEWRVVEELKREFAGDELAGDLWAPRAAAAGLALDAFCHVARSLDGRGLVGRFSTFLEHVKSVDGAVPVTRYNALFHWAVPRGREIDAGQEVGRHQIMTHAYWREGGPEFHDVNVMGVAHGMDKERLLAHKAAIDAHLEEAGIAVGYTAVFWGGRSEIKPSEVLPSAYLAWCEREGLDPAAMRDDPAADSAPTHSGGVAMKRYLKLVGTGPHSNRNLTREEAGDALGRILDGEATAAQAGGFLIGARVQGESSAELLGYLDALQARMTRIRPRVEGLVDIGGPYDGRARTLAIGVGASIVAAAAGSPQVLHGSGPMPPKSGLDLSAILEALGVPARADPAAVAGQIERHGVGYLDARDFAPAIFGLRGLRVEIGLRTAVSTLEKVYDPATAPHHVVGMTHAPYLERLTGAMQQLGWPRSFVVQGLEGSADVPTGRRSRLLVVTPDSVAETRLDPAALGLRPARDADLACPPEAAAHAAGLTALLSGRDTSARRDALLLSAGLRIWVGRGEAGLESALSAAEAALASGAAWDRLEAWRSERA